MCSSDLGEAAKFGEVTGLLGTADALVLVVQAFGEFDHAGKPLDPVAQMESVLLELAVCDLEKVERRLERIEHDRQRSGKAPEVERRALQRCKEQLEKEQPLRTLEFHGEEEKILRTFQFLSLKPLLVVADIAEARLDGSGLESLEAAASERGLTLLRFCAPLEAEIASLDPAEQAAFLKDYGLAEPARLRLIHAAYRALKLASFFTVGEDEVRAWTISDGTAAQAAAGKIHTDMERGFIRAETVSAEALLKAGAWSKCREDGTLRLEGKEYVVRDCDVINFRFGA